MEIGLQLRQAMFLNSILYNSEAWHGVSNEDMKVLESIDEYLLRSLVQGHAKTPLEFLYLETGSTPIRHIISGRRLLYLQTILKREENELTKRILVAQKNAPCPGDFVNLVEADMKMANLNMNYKEIESVSTEGFKKIVKMKIKDAALKHLKDLQSTHSKIKHITYDLFKCQPYILSPIFSNNDVNLLHSLRGRMINCKANFRGRHGDEVSCPLCDDGSVDDQPHILVCPKIVEKLSVTEIAKYKVKYEDIFGDVSKQKEATVLFRKMLDIRKSLLEDETQSLPVAIMTGP